MESIAVPRTSRLPGAFGLKLRSGQSATKASNSPAVLRKWMKNGSCPSGVIVASWSHSTRTGPKKTVQVDPFQPLRHNHRLLTRPVSPRRRRVALHALENARFSPSRQNQTAVSRVNDAGFDEGRFEER